MDAAYYPAVVVRASFWLTDIFHGFAVAGALFGKAEWQER